MGILDNFLNMSPEQNQGLLAAAASLLQAGGPSRTPTSLGQAFGGGLQAYRQGVSEAEKQSREKALMELNKQLLGYKVRDAESDFQNQEIQRKRAAELEKFNRDYFGGAGTSVAPQQPMQQQVASPPQMQAQGSSVGLGGQKQSIFDQRMSYAQALRAAGYGAEADAQEANALKFQPKVKGWEKVQSNGRVLFAPFFEDGTSGNPVPLDVAEKLQEVNRGGTVDLVNPFTGASVKSLSRSATPGEILSSATSRRGQDMTDARAREFNAIKAAEGKAPTEFQGKSAAFGLRAADANDTLNNLQGRYSPSKVNAKLSAQDTPFIGGALGALANASLSEEDQKAEQAQRDFINAILRQESGASISASEFDNARRQYFPQPNDKPGTLMQKARNRALAVQAINANAGKAALSPKVANQNSTSGIKFLGFEE